MGCGELEPIHPLLNKKGSKESDNSGVYQPRKDGSSSHIKNNCPTPGLIEQNSKQLASSGLVTTNDTRNKNMFTKLRSQNGISKLSGNDNSSQECQKVVKTKQQKQSLKGKQLSEIFQSNAKASQAISEVMYKKEGVYKGIQGKKSEQSQAVVASVVGREISNKQFQGQQKVPQVQILETQKAFEWVGNQSAVPQEQLESRIMHSKEESDYFDWNLQSGLKSKSVHKPTETSNDNQALPKKKVSFLLDSAHTDKDKEKQWPSGVNPTLTEMNSKAKPIKRVDSVSLMSEKVSKAEVSFVASEVDKV